MTVHGPRSTVRPWASRAPAAAALAALLAWSSSAAQDPAPRAAGADVPALVAKLGHPDFAEREAAEKALREAGEEGLPALREAARGSADPEVRHRATRLLRALGDVPPEDLAALRADLLRIVREEEGPAAGALPKLRGRLADFAAAHRVAGSGPARVVRSADGRIVVALGRGPGDEGVAGGAAEAEDGKADVVVAIGGAGSTGESGATSGGAATARAGRGLAFALGGRGADSRGKRIPSGGEMITGAGAGGPAEARSPAGGFAFPGTSGAMKHPDGTAFQPERPGELPKVGPETWSRARAFAATADAGK